MKRCSCILMIATLMVAASWPWASAEAVSLPMGETISLDLSGDADDADDSGIVIRNTSNSAGDVQVEYLSENPAADAGGFILLDGTMRVTIGGLQPGDYRLLVVREYDGRKAREKRLIASDLRVIRRKRARLGSQWIMARCLSEDMRKKGLRVAPRRMMHDGTESVLGQYGYYPDDTYVWSVVDQASDFAVGGVPEPSTLVLLLGGGGTLLLVLRGRRIRK